MKRFYKQVTTSVAETDQTAHRVLLDGRAIKTPEKRNLSVPSAALASAIAAEWNAQGEKIDHQTMPLTQLANTALDLAPKQRPKLTEELVQFVDTDLIFFRADYPEALAAAQSALWQPIVDWAQKTFDADFVVTQHFDVPSQPDNGRAAIRLQIEALNDFQFVAIHHVAGLCRSTLIGLALGQGAIDAEAAFRAASVDEEHQLKQWGEDNEARERLDAFRDEILAVGRFLSVI